MTTEYNALIDIGSAKPDDVDLDAFAQHHGVLAGTPYGTLEVILTVPAETLQQAAVTALALVAAAGHQPQALRVMTTDAFDNGYAQPEPQTFSVAEAAQVLGVTPSAVRQRLAGGSLPGRRDGRDWRIPRAAVDRLIASTRGLAEHERTVERPEQTARRLP